MLKSILDDTTINYIVIAIKMTGAFTRRKPASADIFVLVFDIYMLILAKNSSFDVLILSDGDG